MKILYITPAYYPAFKFGGTIEADYQMNVALAKKGLYLDVITTNCGLENRKDIEINKWIETNGIKIKYCKYFTNESYTFSPSLFLEIMKEINKYDLVHIAAFWNFQALAGALACIISKKPYVLTPHGMLYQEAIDIKSKYVKKLYYSLIAKWYLEHATFVHFTTQDEKDNVAPFIKKSLKNQSFVIPIGLDLEKYKQLPPEGLFKEKYPVLRDKKYILFLGRIDKKKGLDILIRAFEKLVKEDDKFFLVIVGPDYNNYANEVKRLIKALNLENKVLFTGMLLGNDKYAAFVDSEMFVLPSYSENFGMAIVEAMACGKPVVISNKVGIYKEIQDANAGIVVEPNFEKLYEGMKKLIYDPALSVKMAKKGKSFVNERYDINNLATMMINAYEGVLNSVKYAKL